MALSPAAEAGLEAFFAEPFLDHYGNTHPSFAVYLKQVIAYLDKEHLEHIFADLDAIKESGNIPQPVLDAIEEIRFGMNNLPTLPTLAAIARAVNDDAALRQKE